MHIQDVDTSSLAPPVSEARDHIRGAPGARLTLVEYGDYECPHCGAIHAILNAVLAQFGDRLRMVYRHFALARIHPHAQRAAEAAGSQGRFWDMHDTIFENQDALDDESLVAYALELGLDMNDFLRELMEPLHAPRVREDFLSGVRSGVKGTPTIFINGRRYEGGWDLESLVLALENEEQRLGLVPARMKPRAARSGQKSRGVY